MKHPKSQRGSAIIMLFVAVALFGALAYAFMRNSRGSTAMISDEQAKIYAQQIIAYGNDIHLGVKRLMARGVKENELSFENTTFLNGAGAVVHTSTMFSTCTSDSCKIFSSAGAGLVAKYAPKGAETSYPVTANSAGASRFASISILGIGTSANDLVLRMLFLDKKVCIKINDILGIENPGGNPPVDPASGWGQYSSGTFPGTGVLGDNEASLVGKNAFCAFWNPGNSGEAEYHYYKVLLAR